MPGLRDTGISTEQNPSHQYTTAGTYTVNLTMTSAGGSNTATQTAYITVGEPPIAGFTEPGTSGPVPLTLPSRRIHRYLLPLTYAWTLGIPELQPSRSDPHLYTTAGTYTVTLTVTGPGRSNTQPRPLTSRSENPR